MITTTKPAGNPDARAPRLDLTRGQTLAYRQRVGALDERLPPGSTSLRLAGWVGFQDSVPRAALHSIYARVADTGPSTWEDPSLVQLWGPRFSAYVVPAADAAVFSLGRLSDDPATRRFALDLAERLDAFLDGRTMSYGDAGHALGIHPNMLRYASTTGRVRIRWEGAGRPTIWTVPAPEMEPHEARLELARRYFHVLGPGTAATLGEWAGLRPPSARRTFDTLAPELTPVRSPMGDGWIVAADEAAFRAPAGPVAPARLLPSGDAYFLFHGGPDRALLLPDPDQRAALWTPRVWPGALLVGGELVGTWRRSDERVTIQTWRPLSGAEREAVEVEAASLPVPGLGRPIAVSWT